MFKNNKIIIKLDSQVISNLLNPLGMPEIDVTLTLKSVPWADTQIVSFWKILVTRSRAGVVFKGNSKSILPGLKFKKFKLGLTFTP